MTGSPGSRGSTRGRALTRSISSLRTALGAASQWAATALLGLVFLFWPNWVGSNMISIPRTHGSLVYQAHLRQGMNQLVARFGGADRVLACGSIMTEGFQVPMVAWYLDTRMLRSEASPLAPPPARLWRSEAHPAVARRKRKKRHHPRRRHPPRNRR